MIYILLIAICIIVGQTVIIRVLYRLLKQTTDMLDAKSREAFVRGKWDLRKSKDSGFIATRLAANGYKSVAIYGCGNLGKSLFSELTQSDVSVKYFIDRNAANIRQEIPVFTSNQPLPQVDVIIVTVVSEYYEIKNSLSNVSTFPIMSLEDLL